MDMELGVKSWEDIIKRWELSGQNRKQFCMENGIKFGTFHYYRKKLKKEGSKFVEIPEINLAHADIELELASRKIKVKIPYSFNEQTLQRLLNVLGV